MSVVFAAGWMVGEDSTGELSSAATKNPDLRVLFWEDVFPTMHKQGMTPVGGVPRTADGVAGWLRANRNLSVVARGHSTIGSALPAMLIDVRVAPRADNDDPTCPAKPCASFLGFPQWDAPYGIAGAGVTRFYLSDVTYDGKPHLLVAAVEGSDRALLAAGLPAAARLIKSARVPAQPG